MGRFRRRQDEDAGSDAQLRALVAEHGAWLTSFCLRLTGGDRQVAEDLVQESLLRAWQHPAALDGSRGAPRAWLATVARNLAADRGRSRRRRPEEVALDDADPHSTGVRRETPEGAGVRGIGDLAALDEADRLIESAVVRAALEQLSAAHQEVLRMVVVEGRPVAQVAEALGIPPGTVKSRVYYALRGLRLALEELAWQS